MFNKKQEFIEFTIDENILKFGNFTLKSGRHSPYFFNTGNCNNGKLLAELTSYYADYIQDHSLNYDFIFGPAYKGITLCSSISQSLFNKYSTVTNYAYNRKEAKTHGDMGSFVGCEVTGKALIVDDVISSGSSIIESHNLLTKHEVTCSDVLVAFNRMEIGSKLMASQEILNNYGMQTHYLIDLDDIYEYINSNTQFKKYVHDMEQYISKYKGC